MTISRLPPAVPLATQFASQPFAVACEPEPRRRYAFGWPLERR